MKSKKWFSALLAGAMAFGLLCAPASAAAPNEAADALAREDSLWLDLAEYEKVEENVTLQMQYHNFGSDNVASKADKAEERTISELPYLPKGATFTVGPNFASDTVFAYSDPDGDGVYVERLIHVATEDGVRRLEVVPVEEEGPFTGTADDYYTNYAEWTIGEDWLSLGNYKGGYRTLTTDYLEELFGADTIIEFNDGDGGRAFYWYLTGHERDEKLGDDKIENYGVSVTGGGQLTSAWAREAVVRAAAQGMLLAYVEEAHNYDLRGSITRGEFAGVAVELYMAMSGEEAVYTDDDPFVDVEAGTDMYAFIMAARDLGIVEGTSTAAKTFEPNKPVSREDAALMLSRVFEALGGKIPAGASTTFADDDRIGSWAMDAVAFMSARGIINGVGSNRFDPKGTASVEQALKIAVEMLDKLDA